MHRTIVKQAGENRFSGRKQYKVDDCFEDLICIKGYPLVRIKGHATFGKQIVLTTNKRYQPGTFINPTKAMRYAMEIKK